MYVKCLHTSHTSTPSVAAASSTPVIVGSGDGSRGFGRSATV